MSTVAEVLARRRQGYARASWAFLAATAAAAVVYVAVPSPTVAAALFGSTAVATTAAVATGVRVHRPALVLPWRLVLAACVLFFVGGACRTVARDDPSQALLVLAAVATVSGYLAVGVAIARWLRVRAQGTGAATAIDAALVGLAVALVVWVVLVAPLVAGGAPATTADPGAAVALDAAYPIIDAVLLTLLVHLLFTNADDDRVHRLLTTSLVAVLVGDVGYAAATAGLLDVSAGLLDTPFLLGYGALGAAALHPSMARMELAQPRQGYRGGRRLPGLVAGLGAAAVLIALAPTEGTLDRVVRAVLLGLLLLGVLARSERAVRRHAAGEQEARRRSTHDELTGLPNRAHLVEVVDRRLDEVTGADQVSLLFVDLDGFKFVNDSYGHSVGDELLVQAGRRIGDAVRSHDVVARYGGDEFVLAVGLGRAATEGLADRVVGVLSEPFTLSVGTVFVSASIGIARSSGRGARADGGVETLVRQADAAMYQAKARGGGGYARYDASLRERARLQIETSTALQEALGRREFEVHYQPIVDLRDGHTVGWEALLRWSRPGHPELGPAVFVPIAEASSVIVPIGEWVLRTACADLARWRGRTGWPLHVSVNVSARQLRDRSLVETVSRTLAETGLPGEALWLELTETALVDDPTTAGEVLAALDGLGVVLCLDDFGTGYSALGYLHAFPMSVVKIDGMFVQALGADRPDATVAGAVQSMSVALGLRTVAEGVETERQADELRALGCHLGQGFHLGLPVPAAEVAVPGPTVRQRPTGPAA